MEPPLVHVRRVTEYLGVTNTRMEELENVREKIQQSWAKDVRKHGSEGPGLLADTSSAVDPALWFFGKWGCSHCEDSRRRIPVASVCDECRFDQLNPEGRSGSPSTEDVSGDDTSQSGLKRMRIANSAYRRHNPFVLSGASHRASFHWLLTRDFLCNMTTFF